MNGRGDRGGITPAGFVGQPLLLLGAVLAAWTAFRVITWTSPFAQLPEIPQNPFGISSSHTAPEKTGPDLDERNKDEDWRKPLPDPVRMAPVAQGASSTAWQSVDEAAGIDGANVRGIVGHNLMLVAGLSQMPVAPGIARFLGGSGSDGSHDISSVPVIPASRVDTGKRWSADAWLFLRNGDGASTIAAGQPSYGRSQAGGVIRYTLVPGGRMRAQAHVRGSAALQGPREREMAAGITARPVPSIPVRLGSELRLRDDGNGVAVRPSLTAVTEFAPLQIGNKARAEVYVQGGYVGGDFATGFVDGQARVSIDVAEFEDSRVDAGAGLWGGAQKDAARLDVGPSAAWHFRLGTGRARLVADYRFRVAGDAAPESGPALTLSTGF